MRITDRAVLRSPGECCHLSRSDHCARFQARGSRLTRATGAVEPPSCRRCVGSRDRFENMPVWILEVDPKSFSARTFLLTLKERRTPSLRITSSADSEFLERAASQGLVPTPLSTMQLYSARSAVRTKPRHYPGVTLVSKRIRSLVTNQLVRIAIVAVLFLDTQGHLA